MMLAHFLLGVSDALGDRTAATARDIALAIRQGVDRLYSALDEPREGTILTVAREVAAAAEQAAEASPDLASFVNQMHREGEIALEGTKLLASLRDAGVVDAGGMGFVRMLEGMVRFIKGDPILPAGPVSEVGADAPAAMVEVAGERDYQYCTEVVVRGERLPPTNEVRTLLHEFGGSVVVVSTGDILKLHVHTDAPEAVFAAAVQWGEVTFEGRHAAHTASSSTSSGDPWRSSPAAQRPAGLGARPAPDRDGASSRLRGRCFGTGRTPAEEFVRLRARNGSHHLPADTGRVREAFAQARRAEVVSVLVSASLSGTFQSASAAARAASLSGVHFVDSGSASLGVGLLALRGAELAESGWKAGDIAGELARVRRQSGVFLTVDQYDNLLRSGRVSRGRAWLAGMLDVKPILTLDADGKIIPIDRVRGREALIRQVLSLVDQKLTPRPKVVRFGVAHAEAPEVAERLRAALVAAYRPRDCFVSLATGVLRRHPRGRRAGRSSTRSRMAPPPTWRAAPGDMAEPRRRPLPQPVRLVVEAIDDRKGLGITVLDLRGVNDATDFFVIASGTSEGHVRGLADAVLDRLERQGFRCHHLEGHPGGRWVLIDFVDFVVHLFHPEARAFYQLERLWGDAPVVWQDPGGDQKGRPLP
jgi:ribosome silencing factor RsfS/YbeB/iojap